MTDHVTLRIIMTPEQYADWQAYCLEHGFAPEERVLDLMMDVVAS